MTAEPGNPPHSSCPACSSDVVIDPSAISLHCANCGHDFFIGTAAEESASSDEARRDSPELDALRIRQRMTMVRSAYRSRSYAIIAMIICAVLAIQSGISTLSRIRAQSYSFAALYLLMGAIGLLGVIYFARKAMAFHREAKQTALDAPTTAPDFSELGDGSQRVRNLEEIH